MNLPVQDDRPPEPLAVLIVELDEATAELCVLALERGGFTVRSCVAATLEEVGRHIGEEAFDVVLADDILPGRTGMEALAMLRGSGIDTPLVLVTGTPGDERALECIRGGVFDYVMKDHLARLPLVVRRALNERSGRIDRRRSDHLIKNLTMAVDQSPASVLITDSHGTIEYVNRRFSEVTGYLPSEAIGETPRLLGSGLNPPKVYEELWSTIRSGRVWKGEILNRRKSGESYWDSVTISPIRDESGSVTHFLATQEDISERKRTQELLLDREERFRQLAENIQEVFFVMAADYSTTLYINPAYERVWGRSRASLYEDPRSFIEAVHPEDRATVMANVARLQAGRAEEEIEFRVRHPDGEVRWVLSQAVPIRDRDGRIYRISGVALDITARKLAEDALRASEAQVRLILSSAAEGIFGLDLDGRCTFCNPAAAELLGFREPAELLGRDMHALTHHSLSDGSPLPPEACRIRRVMLDAPGTHVDDELFWRPDGSGFPVEYWSYPVLSEGAVIGAVVTFLDVTERRKGQKALEESEARFRKLIEASFDGIDITMDGIIVDANEGLAEMFGYTREEMIGRPAVDFAAEESKADVAQQISSGSEGTYELIGVRKDGRRIRIEATARMHTLGGRPARLAALRDVSEVRRLGEQFQQAQKMEAVGRLAGGVAHDFNNLLTVITGYTEVLLEDLGANDPRRTDVEEIRKAAGSATALTRQLLAFSRRQVIEPRVVVLEEALATSEKLLRRLLGEDVELVVTLSQSPTQILIDPGQLDQVIMNLAVNARDAMASGGRITIATSQHDLDDEFVRSHWPATPGRYALLTISDTGVGMDEATKGRIFEPFFTTKEVGKGTGLGLATVYGIVKQSRGFIWLYSEPGQGTVFKLYFPVAAGESTRPATAPPIHPRRGSETVLLVEDDDAVRTVARHILERYGYAVTEAAQGEVALRLAARPEIRVDLLLTDLVMPGMTGRELSERFSLLRPDTPVIFMSGYTDDAILRQGVLEPGMIFLQKPFTPVSLARMVGEVLGRQ